MCFLLYLHLLINVDIKDVCREMLESKRIVIETHFETIKRPLLKGVSFDIFSDNNRLYTIYTLLE